MRAVLVLQIELVQLVARKMSKTRVKLVSAAVQRHVQVPVFARVKGLDLVLALANQAQSNGLHAAC